MTTLANERSSLGSHALPRGGGPIGQAVAGYRVAVAAGESGGAVRDRVAARWAAAEAARLTGLRASQAGGTPGPEGSIVKLQMAELNQAVYDLCLDLIGPQGMTIDGYAMTAPAFAAVHGGTDVRRAYLRSLANSIEGGTSEVMRNILGERVLGLPPEPRADRNTPWRDTRRS